MKVMMRGHIMRGTMHVSSLLLLLPFWASQVWAHPFADALETTARKNGAVDAEDVAFVLQRRYAAPEDGLVERSSSSSSVVAEDGLEAPSLHKRATQLPADIMAREALKDEYRGNRILGNSKNIPPALRATIQGTGSEAVKQYPVTFSGELRDCMISRASSPKITDQVDAFFLLGLPSPEYEQAVQGLKRACVSPAAAQTAKIKARIEAAGIPQELAKEFPAGGYQANARPNGDAASGKLAYMGAARASSPGTGAEDGVAVTQRTQQQRPAARNQEVRLTPMSADELNMSF